MSAPSSMIALPGKLSFVDPSASVIFDAVGSGTTATAATGAGRNSQLRIRCKRKSKELSLHQLHAFCTNAWRHCFFVGIMGGAICSAK